MQSVVWGRMLVGVLAECPDKPLLKTLMHRLTNYVRGCWTIGLMLLCPLSPCCCSYDVLGTDFTERYLSACPAADMHGEVPGASIADIPGAQSNGAAAPAASNGNSDEVAAGAAPPGSNATSMALAPRTFIMRRTENETFTTACPAF